MNCLACGADKDLTKKEFYPYEREGIVQDEAIDPLLMLDCQGPRIPDHPKGYCEFRVTLVCHVCFHKLSPDMWISKRCWEQLAPMTPYEKLPVLDHDDAGNRRKIEHYSLSAR